MTVPGTKTDVQFVFIDTVILAGLSHPTKRWIQPPGPESVNAAQDQWEWIEETLKASTAQWLFVLGHYPGENLVQLVNQAHSFLMRVKNESG